MASMVWHARNQILDTGEVRLFRSNHPDYPDGGQQRDFVYVEDCVDHLVHLWRSGYSGGLVNSGTGAARTFRDLAIAVFAAYQREPRIRYIDMPQDLATQYQNHTQAQLTTLRSSGYVDAPTELEAGVANYIRALESRIAMPRAA
jgi:ADP-L-glycero-D-manno-heptose 6-epimerase